MHNMSNVIKEQYSYLATVYFMLKFNIPVYRHDEYVAKESYSMKIIPHNHEWV